MLDSALTAQVRYYARSVASSESPMHSCAAQRVSLPYREPRLPNQRVSPENVIWLRQWLKKAARIKIDCENPKKMLTTMNDSKELSFIAFYIDKPLCSFIKYSLNFPKYPLCHSQAQVSASFSIAVAYVGMDIGIGHKAKYICQCQVCLHNYATAYRTVPIEIRKT